MGRPNGSYNAPRQRALAELEQRYPDLKNGLLCRMAEQAEKARADLEAREGGEAWEAMWSQIPSEHNAEQVRGVFARSDWFGAVCLDTRDGIKSEAFLLTELLCDQIVRRFGLFTRSKVGVIS